MQQAYHGCELILQTEPCVTFAKLEAGVLEGFEDPEGLVQVEHESERYRVVAVWRPGAGWFRHAPERRKGVRQSLR